MKSSMRFLIVLAAMVGMVAMYTTAGCGSGRITFGDTISGAGPTDEGGGGTPSPIPGGGGGGGVPGLTLSVTGVYPPDNSRGVVVNTTASITFSVIMDPASINVDTIKMFMLGGSTPSISTPIKGLNLDTSPGVPIDVNVDYDEATRTVTLTKDGEWRDCRLYEIVAISGESGVKGANGEILPEDYIAHFLSSCPEVVTFDIYNDQNIAHSVTVANDASGTPRMYVAGSTMHNGYEWGTFVQRWDVSGDIGDPDWENPYLNLLTYDPAYEPEGVGLHFDDATQTIVTAGYVRGGSDHYPWLQAVSPAGTGVMGIGLMLNQVSPQRCRGLAHTTTDRLLLTCLDYDGFGGGFTISHIYSLDNEGTIMAYGGFADLWGPGSMFSAITTDSSGNAYVAITPQHLFEGDTGDYLRVVRFDAEQLADTADPLDNPIANPPDLAGEYLVHIGGGLDVALKETDGIVDAVYVAGFIAADQRVNEHDAFLAKFDIEGTMLWSVRYSGPGGNANSSDAFTAVAYQDGHVYVAGFEGREDQGTGTLNNMIMGKYKDNGASVEEVFQKSYSLSPGLGAANDSAAFDIFIDASAMNEIYVVGYIRTSETDKDIAIWRSDNNGVGTPYCAHEVNFGPECVEAPDFCSDGFDNDLANGADCADPSCIGNPLCEGQNEWKCNDSFDNDGDGAVDCDDTDCVLHHACGGAETDCMGGNCCGDDIDNDGDGKVDCFDWTDCMEGKPTAPCAYSETVCDDGIDNDANYMTDCEDYQCFGPPSCTVETICDDWNDNDLDGPFDCADSDCTGIDGCEGDTELTCNDGIDNDGDGNYDCDDSDCAANPSCIEEICDNGIDDDSDGLIDCDDGECLDDWQSGCPWICEPAGEARCAAAEDYCALYPDDCDLATYPDDACAAYSNGRTICDEQSGCCINPCGAGWSCEDATDMCSFEPSWCDSKAENTCGAALWDQADCNMASGCCETASGCNLSCAGAEASCDGIPEWCTDSYEDPCSAWWWGDELICNPASGCCEWNMILPE